MALSDASISRASTTMCSSTRRSASTRGSSNPTSIATRSSRRGHTCSPDLLGREAEPIDLKFTLANEDSCEDAALVLISNNPYELTHLAGAGTRKRLDSGTLGIVAARVRGREVANLVALELAGQASRFPGLLSWSAQELEVRSGSPVEVGLDGEALVLDPPLHFESLPRALRIRLPRGTGLARGARAVSLTRSNLGTLARVAAGRWGSPQHA